MCAPHTVVQQVLADDARQCLLHLVRLHSRSSGILEGGVGVTLVCDQQTQVWVGLPVCKTKGHVLTVTAKEKQMLGPFVLRMS